MVRKGGKPVGMRKIQAPPDLDKLIERYAEFGSTFSSLEHETGYPRNSLKRWFKDADVTFKNHQRATFETMNGKRVPRPSKESLEEIYSTRTQAGVAEHYGVHVLMIGIWLKEYDIPKRDHGSQVSLGKRNGFEGRLPEISDLSHEYELSGFNKSSLLEKYGLTRYQLDRLFELNGIETFPPARSLAESKLFDLVTSIDPDGEWESSKRGILEGNLELDIYSEKRKLAIEYCGIYWHSELSSKKRSDYHRVKTLKCTNLGIRLITVFETDDQMKVLSVIGAKLGLCESVGARECIVNVVSSPEAREFERVHHLASSHPASINYGLWYEERLVSTMSFCKARYSKKFQYEMSRYTCAGGIMVSGGAQRLWKAFVTEYSPESTISYADMRFGTGEYCRRLGFVREKDSGPCYWYHKNYVAPLKHRSSYQKHKLKVMLSNFDPELTEFENMKADGYDRIWDCGNAVWTWKSPRISSGASSLL